MKAMVLEKTCDLLKEREPLRLVDMEKPAPGPGEILVRVTACGVCHTEIDEIEGRTPPKTYPMVPGHQIVGRVEGAGPEAQRFRNGNRVGIAWIHSACGRCPQCAAGRENLCPSFVATGRDVPGGYAEYTTVHEDFAFNIPGVFSDAEAAPHLCAGAIGYRALRLAGMQDERVLGLSGFGGSAHLVLKLVKWRYPLAKVFVFARSEEERRFALELGASWAGDHGEEPPALCDAIIDTTPVWRPVLGAMKFLKPAGRLIVNSIRKEDGDKDALLSLDYAEHLWLEKELKSVANVTCADVAGFLAFAAEIPIKPELQCFSIEEANLAILELKERSVRGAKVIELGHSGG